MNEKNIYKKALVLAVPMMIQNGITNMVSLIDNVMVGSLGTEAMTAYFCIQPCSFRRTFRCRNIFRTVLRTEKP